MVLMLKPCLDSSCLRCEEVYLFKVEFWLGDHPANKLESSCWVIKDEPVVPQFPQGIFISPCAVPVSVLVRPDLIHMRTVIRVSFPANTLGISRFHLSQIGKPKLLNNLCRVEF